jgi:hypothetical protein
VTGTWRLTATVRTKDSEEDVVYADIRIT